MTKQQAIWASEHDWFVAAYETPAGWAVDACEVVVEHGNVVSHCNVQFSDYLALREWAGY